MAADQELQELVQDFVTESRDHLAHVESDLLNLEATPAEGEGTIHRVFRAVHSVKGVAGFLGLETINRLAHTLESVLDLMRKDQLAPSAELVSVLLGATDRLRDLIEHVSDSNQMAIDEHLARLQAYQGGSSKAAAAPGPTTPTGAAAPAVPVAASEPLQPGERLLECNLSLPALALHTGRPAPQLPDVVAGLGRVVVGAASLCSAAGETPLPSRPVTLRLAVTRPIAEVAAALGLELGELHEIAAAPAGREVAAATPPAAPTAPSRAAAAEPAAKAEPKTKRAEPAATEGSESIRVAVPLLDRLMNLSGELVLGRNQLLQARSTGNDKQAGVAAARLNQVVSEIQEAVMQTRMQPVGTLFQRFPRVVRDLAGKLGKRCTLELEGRDVDLDRSILEALSDPLTHLVRNSIDHGLEKPEERRAAGKPEDGRLTLRAVQQGGNVRLTVGDDGRGIDPVRLRRKAVEKGVITAAQAQALSDREAVHLIFAPGFSTAEKVTDVSGRGVGMDVVRSNIERIGGSVEVQSAVGRGTTVAITIPLTLAILPAMVLENGAQRYVLPQANVAELVRIRDEELAERLVELDGREVLRLRGRLLPLLRLRQVLGERVGAAAGKPTTIVVVETGSLHYGLVVDAPPDAEEIVVKALGRHLKGRPEYAGATILGDGRVAMILDATGIAEANRLVSVEAPVGGSAAEADDDGHDRADLVLFRNHPDETFAVPLGLVDRIQRLPAAELQEVGGQCVYRDGDRILPVVRLEAAVQARPQPQTAHQSVLVLRLGQRQFGLATSQVEDIRQLAVKVDDRTLAEPGLLGSFQLQQRTVRLLDVAALGQRCLPRLFADRDGGPATAGAAERPLRVLFVEDTRFFREHVTRTLREAGFAVTPAADGELAWAELNRPDAAFDVVVTDVQMPNCDGLELTRRIRQSGRRDLPVVALTSLSSAEDEAQGYAAGVTNYLVKLDDAALVAAVRHHARRQA